MTQILQGIGLLLPYLSLLFVGLLSIVKTYYFIRRKFPITVNCWFCNKYQKLPYDSRNSFVCSDCKQYNGFTKDGDYNQPIPEMYYSKLNPLTNCVFSEENVYALKKTNGLCYNCNRNQELKILQLASFVPDNEENYEEEVEQYRQTLEKSYRLCAQCERVVNRSLNQVKRHIFGSKMSKISEKLQNIKNNAMPAAKKIRLIKIIVNTIFVVTIINFFMALNEVSVAVEDLINTFGTDIAEKMLVVISYVLAMKSLVLEIFAQALNNPILQGAFLYITTGLGFFKRVTGEIDLTPFSTLDVKEFINISTMLGTLMLIILCNKQNLGNQLALLFFCSLKTLLDNHEKLVDPIETENLRRLDVICVFMTLVMAYRCLDQSNLTFKHCDDLNKSFHKICPEMDEEESEQEELDDTTYSDSCSKLLNSTLKSHANFEYINNNGSFYQEPNHFNSYSRTPSVLSTSFKSPSELNCSRMSSKQQELDNVGKLTQLNITQQSLNRSARPFSATMENPFYNHINLDRQTPASVASYRARAIISPPKLTRDPVHHGEASWVAGGFWTTSPKKSQVPANTDFMPIMSRTSSQSSGFESQAGIGSRENSVEKCTNSTLTSNLGIRPIRPNPVYAGTENQRLSTSFTSISSPYRTPSINEMTFTKPSLSVSRASLASRQSNRSIFGENNFNDTNSLYSYRSNGRFVSPTSPKNQFNSSRSIFNMKKFRTDLPNL
ncbi:uncharacterized protein LOC134833308 [Culicoides brevitarsis]|uniref:uncharacterized protein LOC134833308 n=1 Tax=Culicoides brevitarsis TaxID=469753 RepID=UPI00307B73FD